jgi:hypothetical protein
MWRRIGVVRADVSEEHVASIFNGINNVLSLLFSSALNMEGACSYETSVLTRPTRRHIPEEGILHNHRRENLKSYNALTGWAL